MIAFVSKEKKEEEGNIVKAVKNFKMVKPVKKSKSQNGVKKEKNIKIKSKRNTASKF